MYRKIAVFIMWVNILFLAVLRASSVENILDKWPCPYLDPETTRRINASAVHTIVEVGSSNDGLSAIRLNAHYKCPVFIFETDSKQMQIISKNIAPYPQVHQFSLQADKSQWDVWMQKAGITNIDLLCVGVSASLEVFKSLGAHLYNVKYIIVSKDSLTPDGKKYLMTEGFQSFFDGVSLFNTVLFVRKNINDLQKIDLPILDPLKKIDPPVLDPLIVGDTHSELIHSAFEDNHEAFHSAYCNKVYDVNYQDSHGNTALIAAASGNASYPLIKLLQLPASDCAIKNEDGYTALMVAAALGNASIIPHLLRDPRGFATIDMVNNLGMTAEQLAELSGSSEIAELIRVRVFNTPVSDPLAMNGENLDVNHQDSHGNTALIIAASCNDHLLVQELLQIPTTDCGLQNNRGCTALMAAAAAGHMIIVNYLLEDFRGISTIDMINDMQMDAEVIAMLCWSPKIANLIAFKKSGNSALEYHKHIIPEKVLICGICKDIAPFVPSMVNIIEQIGGLFEDYKVVVYENDSTDGTQKLLQQWQMANANVDVTCTRLTKKLLHEIVNRENGENPFRIELIAQARNTLLNKVMSDQYDAYPYIVMIDMDFKVLPRVEAIIEIFESKREWDAVFAYGIGQNNEYWDWYAFRDFNQPLGPELLGHGWFGKKRWSLKRTDEWCPVYSAFGGCGIYKRESIRGCRYSGIVTPDLAKVAKKIIDSGRASNHPIIEQYFTNIKQLNQQVNIFSINSNLPPIMSQKVGIVLSKEEQALVWRMNSFVYQYPAVCEHVPFHASMIEKGHGQLFINPRLIFKYER